MECLLSLARGISYLAALGSVMQVMLDPVSRAIANAPIDDEPENEHERQTVAEANEWFRNNPQGIPFEEVLADFGLTVDHIRNDQASK
jgi:hypothetical protein